MTAATIAVAIIAATAGAVAGYILKFVQDTRWIREICETYDDLIEKTNEIHRKEIKRFVDYINAKQQAEIARKMRQDNPILKAADAMSKSLKEALGADSDWMADFENVNEPLPDAPEGWQDIDFGGHF